MKVFRIEEELCFDDITHIAETAEEAYERFGYDDIYVDAPDYVFVGWGFDGSKEGDDRFIKPVPPAGYYYDDSDGGIYQMPIGYSGGTGEEESSIEKLEKENSLLKAQIKAMSDRNDFIEDCIAEMAMTVYANG